MLYKYSFCIFIIYLVCWNLKLNLYHLIKPKKKILRNIWIKNFLSRNYCSFFFFLRIPLIILFFGSGNFLSAVKTTKTPKISQTTKTPKDFAICFWFRKLLLATKTKTTKNPKTSKKNKDTQKTKKTKDSEECLGQGLCSEILAVQKINHNIFW